MAKIASPYGLRPVNLQGGQANPGSMRQYKIKSAYNTDILAGDLVSLVIGGTIEKFTGTTTGSPVGVFMGVAYTDAAMGYLHKNKWAANTVAADAMAYICDDPDMLFEVQADGSLGQNAIGTNAAVVQGAGNAVLGISGMGLKASSIAVTATLPLRIVDMVARAGFSQMGDDYTDVIVRINTHFNRSATGIAAA